MAKKSLAEKVATKLEAIQIMLNREHKTIAFDKDTGTGYIVPAGSYVDYIVPGGDEPDDTRNLVDLSKCECVQLPGMMFYADADCIVK